VNEGQRWSLAVEREVVRRLVLSGDETVPEWAKPRISPAPAVATFDDVPTTHPFFPFIEALVRAGITTGCDDSPPLFCPDGVVTRKQLAKFLSTALGLHWSP